jgi:hypothetical protein
MTDYPPQNNVLAYLAWHLLWYRQAPIQTPKNNKRIGGELTASPCTESRVKCYKQPEQQNMLQHRYTAAPGLPFLFQKGRPVGIRPFRPRIILAMPPLDIFFIIFCICMNCFSSLFTSCTWVPDPVAIRLRREALMMSG